MALDAATILEEIRMFIPSENVLTDVQMITIINYVIADVGSDDSNAAEVKCKSLQAIGTVNLAKASTISSGVKKEKIGDSEQEWFGGTSGVDAWKDFLDSLRDVCPIFGYYGLAAKGGIKVTPGETPDLNPTCYNYSDLDY